MLGVDWFAVGASMFGIGIGGLLFSPGAHYCLSQTSRERDSITFFRVSAETMSSWCGVGWGTFVLKSRFLCLSLSLWLSFSFGIWITAVFTFMFYHVVFFNYDFECFATTRPKFVGIFP